MKCSANPLSTLFDAASLQTLRGAFEHDHPEELNPLRLAVRDKRFDGIVYRIDGGEMLVELEPLPSDAPAYSPHHALRPALLRIQSADTLFDLYRQLLRTVRELTGFERVMIYRFDERGHGSVDAENKKPELESYVGLHYPASDIPRQARELYLKQRLRIIPDAGYVPARLKPELRPDTGAPLDLSCAALRSVSPIHREYLENMGVRGVDERIARRARPALGAHQLHESQRPAARALRAALGVRGARAARVARDRRDRGSAGCGRSRRAPRQRERVGRANAQLGAG